MAFFVHINKIDRHIYDMEVHICILSIYIYIQILIIRSPEGFSTATPSARLRSHWASKTAASEPVGLENGLKTVISEPLGLENGCLEATGARQGLENGCLGATGARKGLENSCLGATGAREKPQNVWFSCRKTYKFMKSPLSMFEAPKWRPEYPEDSPEATHGTQRHA